MKKKAVVSERALMARVKRYILRTEGGRLFKNRGGPYSDTLPKFYSVDDNNHICNPGFDDIEEYAREHNILKPYEKLPEG